MSRRAAFSQMWIPVDTRLPNPEVHREILTYHEETGLLNHPWWPIVPQMIEYTKQIRSGEEQRPPQTISAMEFTHWMPAYAPEGMTTNVEDLHKKKEKKVSRRRS